MGAQSRCDVFGSAPAAGFEPGGGLDLALLKSLTVTAIRQRVDH